MNQLGLDLQPPRARRKDPDTSHAAARKAALFQGSHHKLILDALAVAPGNIYELGRRTGLGHVAVARRLPELDALKLAEPTEEKREGCRVWRRKEAA